MKILHFADAHIDISQYGPVEPDTGIPARVRDFLNSLDEIVDAAIRESVDMVLFAGDAYRDRTPHPTFQREWEKRILRLSQAKIPTLLLTGNHDMPKASMKAHALAEFETLQIPYVHVLSKAAFVEANAIGLPIQVIALPWIYLERSEEYKNQKVKDSESIHSAVEDRVIQVLDSMLKRRDEAIPTILLAHAAITGSKLGDERELMLGGDFQLTPGIVKDPRYDYVALGHIHRAQNLNGPSPDDPNRENLHPPVIYPGSIERVNFGESAEDKYYVIAEVSKGITKVEWRQLQNIRKFYKKVVLVTGNGSPLEEIFSKLPEPASLAGAVIHIAVEHPSGVQGSIDEKAIKARFADAFEVRVTTRVQREARSRLGSEENTSSISDIDLLDRYLEINKINSFDKQKLFSFAKQVLDTSEENEVLE